MTKRTIKFGKYQTPIPIFKCKTDDGKEFVAMVDTGSEVTIFDTTLSDILTLEEGDSDEITLHSMHGEDESSASTYRLTLHAETDTLEDGMLMLKGIKSDLSSVSKFLKESYGWKEDLLVVIGSDTLKEREWIVDFDDNQIILA